MITFGDIQKRVREIFSVRYEPEGVRPLADMYWRTLITLGFLLVVCALVFGLWTLFGVFDALASATDTSPPPPAALNSTTLHNLADGFDARKTRFDQLSSSGPSAIADPSR